MKELFSKIIAGVLGLWAADLIVPGVQVLALPDSNFLGIPLTTLWQIFLVLGIVIGLINFFVKPVLMIITLPLRIITLGIFSVLVNMALIWAVDIAFEELTAPLFWPLFWTSFIIGIASVIVQKWTKKHAPEE